jgi:hypothetical protein
MSTFYLMIENKVLKYYIHFIGFFAMAHVFSEQAI